MRTFIAIELPEDTQADIFHTFEKFSKLNLIRGKFVEKENLHLTLKFLGELTLEQVEKVKDSLKKISFESFYCEVGGVGAFPNENHPKVLHVELKSKNNEIKNLHDIIENELIKIGIPKENQEFKSHITVARIYVIKDKKTFAEKFFNIRMGKMEFRIENFSLIKSELTPKGPIYKVLDKFSLKK